MVFVEIVTFYSVLFLMGGSMTIFIVRNIMLVD